MEEISILDKFPFSFEGIEGIRIVHVFDNNDDVSPYKKKGENALVVTKFDKVYAYGGNAWGVLGLGSNLPATKFTEVQNLSGKGVVNFANGYNFVLARTKDLKVYSWGNNYYGQLGLGHNLANYEPRLIEVSYAEKIVDISCGVYHSLILTKNGDIYTCGLKNADQGGEEDETMKNSDLKPRKIVGIREKIKAISCGSYFSLALSENGNVYSWGRNNWGQLGNGKGEFTSEPNLIRIGSFIVKICCGYNFSLLLSEEGNIYEFGWQVSNDRNYKKRLIPIKFNYPKRFIDIGAHFECGITLAQTEDDIYCLWGIMNNELYPVLKESEFKSFNQIFIENYKIVHTSMNLSDKNSADVELRSRGH